MQVIPTIDINLHPRSLKDYCGSVEEHLGNDQSVGTFCFLGHVMKRYFFGKSKGWFLAK